MFVRFLASIFLFPFAGFLHSGKDSARKSRRRKKRGCPFLVAPSASVSCHASLLFFGDISPQPPDDFISQRACALAALFLSLFLRTENPLGCPTEEDGLSFLTATPLCGALGGKEESGAHPPHTLPTGEVDRKETPILLLPPRGSIISTSGGRKPR